MEENNNIFLDSDDAPVYLAEPMHKKYSTAFVWGHPFKTYVSYDHIYHLPRCTHMYAFRENPLLRMWFHRFDTPLSYFDFTLLLQFPHIVLPRIYVFASDTHHLLVSHSVSSSLPRRTTLLMMASNYQLFYLLWSLTKLSYVNVKDNHSRKTTTVIVTVLTKLLSFN